MVKSLSEVVTLFYALVQHKDIILIHKSASVSALPVHKLRSIMNNIRMTSIRFSIASKHFLLEVTGPQSIQLRNCRYISDIHSFSDPELSRQGVTSIGNRVRLRSKFAVIAPWGRVWAFICKNLNSIYPRMLCAKFGLNWSRSFKEKIFKYFQ